jgi:hypothetical protein
MTASWSALGDRPNAGTRRLARLGVRAGGLLSFPALITVLARSTPLVIIVAVAVALPVILLVTAHAVTNGRHAWRGTDPGPAWSLSAPARAPGGAPGARP